MAGSFSCSLPMGGDSAAAQLCDAVQAKLKGIEGKDIELVVTVAGPTHMQALLRHGKGDATHDGPELAVTIMDRDSFPDGVLQSFATNLVDSIK